MGSEMCIRDRFYIEFVLLFMGQLQRTRLSDRFGISNPAATKDLSLYAELNPEFSTYDFRQKCYRYVNGVAPLWPHSVESSFLALSGHLPNSRDVAINPMIASSVGESIKRRVDINMAASITRCIHQRKVMSAKYRSIRSGEHEKIISPLAIIHDGLRWHIRGYDEDQRIFKDYTLARFLAVTEGADSKNSLSDDPEWDQEVDLLLVTHPRAKHPETVELDYEMKDGKKVVRIKSCMVGYFLRRWPIDYSENADGDPEKEHLFLANSETLLAAGVSRWALGKLDE